MTKEEARAEISYRLERETRYVLKLADLLAQKVREREECVDYLNNKVEDNDRTIRLLGEWLGDNGDEWEKFYKGRYWDLKK